MSKKIIWVVAMFVLILGIFLISGTLKKDDDEEIKKAVYSLGYPLTVLAHIEILDSKNAIAFYEWGHEEEASFGNVILKKKLWGWEIVGGGSLLLLEESKLNGGHTSLRHYLSEYTDLLRGKIVDPNIAEVRVITRYGSEYEATIVEYNNNDKFWFLISGEDFLGSKVTGFSTAGDIIEEIVIE
ncbi:hypothetical protein [Alkalihalobacterium chitinilyticum]|uniref:DUF4340 domain-containing protein n=1 Tax=Alkalihalobacterium chitinilyticum TaxID=2980103 RepID=A0ABT5VL42_9BACI|nr:hypothetical protein [Alkalihalobacterium chitinilyticum]MDE5416151.1 hypothetical protein [Alkalihalobacterium chitinilyticum]